MPHRATRVNASMITVRDIFEAFSRVAQWGISARLHGHSAASIRR